MADEEFAEEYFSEEDQNSPASLSAHLKYCVI